MRGMCSMSSSSRILFTSLLRFSYPYIRGVHNAGIIGIVVLISYAAPFMHAYEKVPGQEGHTSLSSRYVYCRLIRLQKRGHMTLVECNYEWSVRTPVQSAYAHRTEVAVIFHFTTPELPIIAL